MVIFIILLSRIGHPSCLEMSAALVCAIKTYPWQCMECKTCTLCGDPTHEVSIQFFNMNDLIMNLGGLVVKQQLLKEYISGSMNIGFGKCWFCWSRVSIYVEIALATECHFHVLVLFQTRHFEYTHCTTDWHIINKYENKVICYYSAKVNDHKITIPIL